MGADILFHAVKLLVNGDYNHNLVNDVADIGRR
jgi:hypothetical protein